MDFTPEQRAYIDRELKLSDEWQERNGNKTYTMEEVFDKLLKDYKEEENYRI